MKSRSGAFLGGLAILPILASGCSKSAEPATGSASPASGGTVVVMNSSADLESPAHFFDFPWPSDLRLSAERHARSHRDAESDRQPRSRGLRDRRSSARGFPVVPVAWFQFTAPITPRDPSTDVVAAEQERRRSCSSTSIPRRRRAASSCRRSRRRSATTTTTCPPNVARRWGRGPGSCCPPTHQYAYVVLRSPRTTRTARCSASPSALATIVARRPGAIPLSQLFAPLWPALQDRGGDADAGRRGDSLHDGRRRDGSRSTCPTRFHRVLGFDRPTSASISTRPRHRTIACASCRRRSRSRSSRSARLPTTPGASSRSARRGCRCCRAMETVPVTITLPKRRCRRAATRLSSSSTARAG